MRFRFPRWHQLQEAWKRSAFAVMLFLIVSVSQYGFVWVQVTHVTDNEMAAWTAEVAKQIHDGSRWTVPEFRRASLDVPNLFIVAADGTVIDIDSTLPAIFGSVAPLPAAVFDGPTTVSSEFGETWRLLARHLDDGFVVLGVREAAAVLAPDTLLRHETDLFGSAISVALRVPEKRIDENVEFAVVGDDGRLRRASGGIPLRMVDAQERLREGTRDVRDGSNTYRVLCTLVRSSGGEVVGRVSVDRDVTLQRETLRRLLIFDGALLGLSVLLLLAWAARHIRLVVDVEEALRRGEGPEIEFKSSFQWDVQKQAQNKELQKEVVKAIAAFLNTAGGHLFVGVTDDRMVCGLDGDLQLMEGSADKLLRTIVQRLLNDIGGEFAGSWQARIEKIGGRVVCGITVDPANDGAWMGEELYIRSGSSSRPLKGREAAEYLKHRRRKTRIPPTA